MNAASNVPDEEPTGEQITTGGAGPAPGPPGPGGLQPGPRTVQPGRRPPGYARPARAGFADEDSHFGGGPAGSRGENEPSRPAAAASPPEENGLAADREPHARLLDGDQLERIVIRWKEIQAHFVDEPRTAVEQADALVASLMAQLAATLARERAALEQHWANDDGVSTEELRQSLRRYRSFFKRLLAA